MKVIPSLMRDRSDRPNNNIKNPNGKRRPNRSPSQKAAHRQLIAALYLQGWIQDDIAKEVGLSQATVSLDLNVIRETWLESTLMNFNERQAIELAKIDLVEGEYWEAWIRSCALITHRSVYDQTSQSWEQEKIELEQARDGDPRFLEGVLKCVRDRCNILGIKAAEKLELTGKDGGVIKVISGLDLGEDI